MVIKAFFKKIWCRVLKKNSILRNCRIKPIFLLWKGKRPVNLLLAFSKASACNRTAFEAVSIHWLTNIKLLKTNLSEKAVNLCFKPLLKLPVGPNNSYLTATPLTNKGDGEHILLAWNLCYKLNVPQNTSVLFLRKWKATRNSNMKFQLDYHDLLI